MLHHPLNPELEAEKACATRPDLVGQMQSCLVKLKCGQSGAFKYLNIRMGYVITGCYWLGLSMVTSTREITAGQNPLHTVGGLHIRFKLLVLSLVMQVGMAALVLAQRFCHMP